MWMTTSYRYPGGMDWGSFGGVPRGFGIVGDSYVRLFVADLVCAGAPVGTLGRTSRTLRGANGTGIGVCVCSHCVVSCMGW